MSSSAQSRTPRVKSGPTAFRTAAMTSRGKRMRFSKLPPYSSPRKLVSPDMNCRARELCPYCSSTPSKPPSRTCTADLAKYSVTSRMSSISMALGVSR